MKVYVFAGLALLGLAGLSLSQEQARRDSTPRTNAVPVAAVTHGGKAKRGEPYTVIGYLEKRDCVITIKTSARGPVYSVATKDGKVLFENVSAEQLKAQALEIHDLIKTGVVGDPNGQRPIIDASLRISAGR